jgi:hypothetical protein
MTVTWPKALIDEYGNRIQIKITGLKFQRIGATSSEARFSITDFNQVTITPQDATAFEGVLTVYGKFGDPRIEDYGGDLDKHDSETEVIPYAFLHYQDLSAAFGSAYGNARSGVVHAKKLARARGLAAVDRSIDRLKANSSPDTADVMLEHWAKCLRVKFSANEPRWRVRRRCANMQAAESGESITKLETALRTHLGSSFVALRRFGLETDHGIWPASYNIDGKSYASLRSRILVDVVRPADVGDEEFRRLVQVEMIEILERLCPSKVVFDWTSTSPDGFLLGISRLSIDGL